MKEISATQFKANCLSVVEQVRKTRKPVRITRYGRPVARIEPEAERPKSKTRLGLMAGTVEIIGDIVAPAFDEDDWYNLRNEAASGHTHPDVEPIRTKAVVSPRGQGPRPRAK